MNIISARAFPTYKRRANSMKFIPFKEIQLGEYDFIYHINDGYSINSLTKFSIKEQLLFQKMGSKMKQMNLMIVDSIFPLILSDLVLEVFLNDISSITQFIASENRSPRNNS